MAAREQQLQPTEVVGFPSMAVADIDHMALSSIKAVSPGTRCGVSCLVFEPYGEIRIRGHSRGGRGLVGARLFSLLMSSPETRFRRGATLRISGAVGVSPTRPPRSSVLALAC